MKIQTKPFDEDVTIVIDPYKPAEGSFPRNLTADILLYSRGENGSITVTGNPFTLATAGECEMKNVLMAAIPTNKARETMLRFDSEGMSIAHLGLTKQVPTDKQLETINGVDILIIPVGHADAYTAETARKVVQMVEPRVVIPMAYQSDNDPKSAKIDDFVKELGVVPEHHDKKVIIKAKNLPQEEMKMFIISKE